MGNINLENNSVTLVGEVVSKFRFNHEFCGEKFYIFDLAIKRLSEQIDYIPVMVSERLIDVTQNLKGVNAYVSGCYRSYNFHEGEKSKLLLTVFANEIETNTEYELTNNVFLEGYVCKEPTYRKTPMGREISDTLIAVNRAYGKSDYIPCVMWGRNARYSATLPVGTKLKLWGRVQSREYVKVYSDTEYETKVAYEISVTRMEVVNE